MRKNMSEHVADLLTHHLAKGLFHSRLIKKALHVLTRRFNAGLGIIRRILVQGVPAPTAELALFLVEFLAHVAPLRREVRTCIYARNAVHLEHRVVGVF